MTKAFSVRLESMPAFPETLLDLLSTVRDERIGMRAVSSVLASDPSLASNVLRLANSAMFGAGQRCDNVAAAVQRIGLQEVANLANALWLKGAMPKMLPFYGEQGSSFLFHSVSIGMLAQKLAATIGLSMDGIYTSGLLHDVGKLAVVPTPGEKGAKLVIENDETELDAERRSLGTDHTEIGAELGTRWKFPVLVIASMRQHHSFPVGTGDAQQLPRVIHLASMLERAASASAASTGASPTTPASSAEPAAIPPSIFDLRLLRPLGLDEAKMLPIANKVLSDTKAIIESIG